VRVFDTDGLRVMTASRAPDCRDVLRREMTARSPMSEAIVKRDLPSLLSDLVREMGAPPTRAPPAWVLARFAQDRDIVEYPRGVPCRWRPRPQ